MMTARAVAGTLAIALLLTRSAGAQVVPCPVPPEPSAPWMLHKSPEFGIAISAPIEFERKNFSSRSDSTHPRFSLWKTAVTTVDIVDASSWEAEPVIQTKHRSCVLRTRTGDVQVLLWRQPGQIRSGGDTLFYFEAGTVITVPGRRPFVARFSASDSVKLLGVLQILRTVEPLKSPP